MLEGHRLVVEMLMVEVLVVEVLPVGNAIRAGRAAGAVAAVVVAKHAGNAQLTELVPEASTAGFLHSGGRGKRRVQLIRSARRPTQLIRVEATR